jgi:BlaI family transcriptional regulator, penicillinase repressor
MTSRKTLPQIAPAELEVMKVLWAAGGLSGREVHERLADQTGWAYSTTRTTIERMAKKGLVTRRTFHGLHVYEPAISRAQGVARLVREFASRVLGLSHVPVAALFRESEALTPAELEELRSLLAPPRRQKKARS